MTLPADLSHIDPDLVPILQGLDQRISTLENPPAPAPTPVVAPTDVITLKTIQNINFTQGLKASVSVAGFATSSLGLPLGVMLNGALPPGVTFDPVAETFNYDGVGLVGTSIGNSFTVSDGRTP